MKINRQEILAKTHGRCGYCGVELNGKFHLDHMNAVVRKNKTVHGHYKHPGNGLTLTPHEAWTQKIDTSGYEWVERKTVSDGFHHPENNHVDNLMAACVSCNVNKGSMDVDGFRNFIYRFTIGLKRDNKIYRVALRYGLVAETGNPVKFYFETTINPPPRPGNE